jgi:ATP-binding cassette subfamily B protein IrtA
MKQQKDNWVKILFSFAAPCKGKMALSVFCAILSVAGGFIPFWAVYEILLAFINQNVTLNGILIWCLVGAAGYLLRVACHGISTILAHISAYTVLEGIRLKIADRLMKAPLGEVMGRRIGYLKNIIMDKVEDLEPPLAHMIPELTSNLLLPVAIFTWMMVIDWRMGLAVLIAPVLAMIPMFFLMRNYNSQYAAYMEANNHVNSIIIEYVEGIEVVKAFNQSTSSYEKFVNAVQSFKEFTLAWFKSTWKTMNLMMAIMPTTLLGVLPVGLLLVQNGSISPAELAMGIILSLSIVAYFLMFVLFSFVIFGSVENINDAAHMLGLIDSAMNKLEALRNVTLRYKKRTILHDIGLSAGKGEVIGVVGHNGAGKTTFSRALCGLHKDCEGQFLWEGKSMERKARLKRSYMVMQDVNYELFADSVEAECSFGIRNPNQTLVNVTLEELGLAPYRERHPNTLSGGQKQRVAVAVSMICGKDLLVFDEPTSGLDFDSMTQVAGLIRRLSNMGKVIFIVTHDFEFVCRTCSRVLHFDEGEMPDDVPVTMDALPKLRELFSVSDGKER